MIVYVKNKRSDQPKLEVRNPPKEYPGLLISYPNCGEYLILINPGNSFKILRILRY